MKGPLTWQTVVIAVTAIAAVVVMAVLHLDTNVIIGVVASLGLGGMFANLQNTNGNHTLMLNMLKDAMDKLHKSQPPTDAAPGEDQSKDQ